MKDIRDIIRERDAAELDGAAKRRQSWLALQREDEVGSDWRESESTLMQYPGATGIAGVILCIVGLAFSFSLFTPLSILLLGFAVACIATGLTLSGIAFYQAIEDGGTPHGILIVGLASGVAAIMVLVAWVAVAISTPWPTSWS